MENPLSKILKLICLCLIMNLNSAYSQKKSYITIDVHTGKVSGAGTDANVSLTLNTEQGSVKHWGKPIVLNPKFDYNVFESGNVDKARILYRDFTNILSINISHDNAHRRADWFLDKIVISTSKGAKYYFDCYCMLEGESNGRTINLTKSTGRPKPPPPPDARGVYYIQSAIAGKYMDVQWGKSTAGTPLHLWPRNGGAAQKFYFEDAGDGEHFYIKSALGKYVHAINGKEQAPVRLGTGKGEIYSLWKIEKVDDYYRIKSKMGRYIEVAWGNSKDGTPIFMFNKNNSEAQRWKFIKRVNNKFVPRDPPTPKRITPGVPVGQFTSFPKHLEYFEDKIKLFTDSKSNRFYHYIPSKYTLIWDKEDKEYSIAIHERSKASNTVKKSSISMQLYSGVDDLMIKYLEQELDATLIPIRRNGELSGEMDKTIDVSKEDIQIEPTTQNFINDPIKISFILEGENESIISQLTQQKGIAGSIEIPYINSRGQSTVYAELSLDILDESTLENDFKLKKSDIITVVSQNSKKNSSNVKHVNKIKLGGNVGVYQNSQVKNLLHSNVKVRKKNKYLVPVVYKKIYALGNDKNSNKLVFAKHTVPYNAKVDDFGYLNYTSSQNNRYNLDITNKFKRKPSIMWLDLEISEECKACVSNVYQSLISGTSQIFDESTIQLNVFDDVFESGEIKSVRLRIFSKQLDKSGKGSRTDNIVFKHGMEQEGPTLYVPSGYKPDFYFEIDVIDSSGNFYEKSKLKSSDKNGINISRQMLEGFFKELIEEN